MDMFVKQNINIGEQKNTVVLEKAVNTTDTEAITVVEVPKLPSISGLDSFAIRQEVQDAEILWLLNVVMKHKSLNSLTNDISIMKRIFPDSSISMKMTLSPAKASYVINYGLAPYYKSKLDIELNCCDRFVVCFDESLNKISQKCQMDILIRFFNRETNVVETRYFKSVFLQHSSARDILAKFKEGLENLDLKKLLQISMDGPNVNWKFFSLLQEEDDSINVIDIGSCGLHVVHGSLQVGHKKAKWKVNEFLRGIYYLFNNSPARRADFTSTTECTQFPFKFCQVRWVENARACERALQIIDSIKQYVENKNIKLPANISITNVKDGLRDNFIKPKLAFFASISHIFEPFLIKYQTVRPMVPFIYSDLTKLLRDLLRKFVKEEYVNLTVKKMLALNFGDNNILLPLEKIDIGFGARKYFKELKGVSHKDKLMFRQNCRQFFIETVKKIFERCNLKHNLIKYVSCLNPNSIYIDRDLARTNAQQLFQVFHDKNMVSQTVAEKAQIQFNTLTECNNFLQECKDFLIDQHRLDTFFYDNVGPNHRNYKELWNVIVMVLILSHGNATVESGFSVNKNILVENLQDHSLIAQRQIFDSVKNGGGILNVKIDSVLRNYVQCSYRNYKNAIDEDKRKKIDLNLAKVRKQKVKSQLYHLEMKKKKLEEGLTSSISNLDAEIAELRKEI